MTARQFYMMFSIFVVTLKIQKLPCIMSEGLGKDSIFLAIVYFAVDFALVAIALAIANKTREHSYDFSDNKPLLFFKKLLLLFVAVYFLLQGLLFYEAIQDLFSHILFDNLPWAGFSLLLLAGVFYLANSGLKNIALQSELYGFVVFGSILLLVFLALSKSDFTVIFPLQSINFSKIADHALDFNFWFGDFFIVLLLARRSQGVKMGPTLLVFGLSALITIFMFIEFQGIYQSYAAMQSSLISTISEQSMLGAGVGRVDWFLILLTQIGTIVSSGVCFYFAKKSLAEVFPKIKQPYLLAVIMVVVYCLDVFLLVDLQAKQELYTGVIKFFAFGLKVIVVVVGVIVAACTKKSGAVQSKIRQQQKEQHRRDKLAELNKPISDKITQGGSAPSEKEINDSGAKQGARKGKVGA